jgi:hypothetical protein
MVLSIISSVYEIMAGDGVDSVLPVGGNQVVLLPIPNGVAVKPTPGYGEDHFVTLVKTIGVILAGRSNLMGLEGAE